MGDYYGQKMWPGQKHGYVSMSPDKTGPCVVGECRADGKKKREQGGGGKQMSHHVEFIGFAKNPGLILRVPRNR